MENSREIETGAEQNEIDVMNEYKDLFLLEVKEHLVTINDSLLAYEENHDKTHIEELFRSVHTIKSSSAMMGFDELSSIAHKLEDTFDLARNGVIVPGQVIDLFFEVFDMIEAYITKLEKDEKAEIDCSDIIVEIGSFFQSAEQKKVEEPQKIKESTKGYENLGSIESIRVKTDDLDKLLNLVGELVINKSQLNQVLGDKSSGIKHTLNNVDRISVELQDIVTKIRMVPVGQILNRFPRLVRDLSHQENKEVDLLVEGKDIELDRKILEEIGEPLIHIIRNAVDHGIESPEEREKNGKDRTGTIKITAERNQENILIRVSDDGAGIDPERIKAKALSDHLLSESELNAMNDKQLVNLIMLNGLTTAEDVTSISGRGVGMNIVKTKIEKLGGSVIINTELGSGTEFLLKLPLTLSILTAVLIESNNEVYAVPVNFVEEIVAVNRKDIRHLGHTQAIQIRDLVIKIADLRVLLNAPPAKENKLQLLIIKNEDEKFGLIVDSILGQREIMTKKLSDSLQKIRGISGVTILGDGRVIIVLDPVSLYFNDFLLTRNN